MDSAALGKEFIQTILQSIVDRPDAISVESVIDARGVFIKVSAHPDDRGRLIGRQGETIEAIRIILKALGKKNQAYYAIKVTDDV